MRIVSLLPGATESLFALGLGSRVVGVTHECDFPSEAALLPRVTRSRLSLDRLSGAEIEAQVARAAAEGQELYEVDYAVIRELAPDLVVAQDVCDVCAVPAEQVEAGLEGSSVLRQHPHSLQDVLGGIEQLAATCGGDPSLVPRLRDRLDHVHEFVIGRRRTRMVFLEWLDPPYPAGHWTPDLIRLAGGEDPLARPGRPSVPITWSEVRAAKPQALVIAPCGYSRPRAEAEARRCRDVPWTELDGRVCVLDGSAYFNRPGPRVVDSVEILAGFLHGYNPGS